MAVARIESIDDIKTFRAYFIKFAETASAAVTDAESDVIRTLNWLEHEQAQHWTSEVRRRTELVARAKEAVRMKKVFKDASGRTQGAHDEEKALAIANRHLEEAQQKFLNTKKYARLMVKEIQTFKGNLTRLLTALSADIPRAIGLLDRHHAKLAEYLSLAMPNTGPSTSSGEGPMARPEDDAPVDVKIEDETVQGPEADGETKDETSAEAAAPMDGDVKERAADKL